MSKASKKREHLVRNGRLDPAIRRGNWNGVKPITKKTPTKRQLIDRLDYKHKVVDL